MWASKCLPSGKNTYGDVFCCDKFCLVKCVCFEEKFEYEKNYLLILEVTVEDGFASFASGVVDGFITAEANVIGQNVHDIGRGVHI